ncbi:peptide chain release factor N(5)-glutamine methyltransferase [Microvirga sp. 17 mud 1-3]|uniref:peptide chain release factor N(5)-glutamine methyltransferase n=1 Tax=Microvirga sp. 17 mud 1-3 TaxID=2082949 RepID=UPI000D6C841B|nr:peptide chain release factor N(5)-glutamine methyltransferase [Microvirga sp. 17 mud 1-3]AWM85759.1 peptide chain release factor N(5)-glutamine methyltransferase [Microvirga sp. 17 mud 1-3]
MSRDSTSPPDPASITRAQALARLRHSLAEGGIENPALDARLLLLAALGISPAELVMRPEALLTEREAEILADFARRRLAREPVARILGEREFWGMPFRLSADTLVPRPDTETVIETALALLPDRQAPLRIVDFGTGSGAILTALLHELPRAWGIGVDLAEGAARMARENARANGVGDRASFVVGNWADCLKGPFELVVSNPPYIASEVVGTLDREVREHDPRLALDGGPDGLEPYRVLLGEADRLLAPDGLMVFEIGYDQGESVSHLAAASGLETLRLAHDLSGNTRCIALKRTRSHGRTFSVPAGDKD